MFLVIIIILKMNYDNSIIGQSVLLKRNSVIGWIFLIWSVISWNSLRNELISLYIAFLMLLYSFTFGQSLLLIFNLVSENRDLLFRISELQIIEAQIFTLMSLISFHLGALILCKKPNNIGANSNDTISNTKTVDKVQENSLMLMAIRYTGVILLVFSLPGFIYNLSKTLIIVSQSGYGALYGYHTGGLARVGLFERIFEYTSSYFLPSLICLLVAFRNKKRNRRIIVSLMILDILTRLYIGGRGGAAVLILVIILIYHYCISPINKKQFFLIIIGGYFTLSFFAIVAQLRNVAERSFSDYFSVLIQSFGENNLFFETISELGWSMFPLAAVMSIIPSRYNFFMGKSYIYALTSIIPNLGFWDIHLAKVHASSSTWLMETLNLWSGPGFSMVAEAFRNFGWYGFIVLIGFGMLFGRIYTSVDKFTVIKRPDLICIVMIFFNATLLFIRGDNLLLVRPIFYVVLPIYMLIHFIYNELLRRK